MLPIQFLIELDFGQEGKIVFLPRSTILLMICEQRLDDSGRFMGICWVGSWKFGPDEEGFPEGTASGSAPRPPAKWQAPLQTPV